MIWPNIPFSIVIETDKKGLYKIPEYYYEYIKMKGNES